MATKDDRPGLLSKVAMFVRNPTKDWSELERSEPEQESGYDKQALKAMIERKRQNDFVRKREFDQLRKLRNRDPSVGAGLVRPSFFQSSISSDPDGRAVTLKKIDEIEAQMSKQWWKGKQDAALAQGSPAVAGSDLPDGKQLPPKAAVPTVPAALSSRFEATESSGLYSSVPGVAPSEYAATQMGNGTPPPMSSHIPLPQPLQQGVRYKEHVGGNLAFSTSELFAIDVDDMTTDPELEEAAIRFANGDDVGAEKGLLDALKSDTATPQASVAWAAALMDLYRVTGNRARFDWALVELAQVWGASQPAWAPLLSGVQEGRVSSAESLRTSNPLRSQRLAERVTWHCPPRLTAQAMEDLREAMSSQPMPWVIDWSSVTTLDAEAMPLLGGLFGSLCDEVVALRFGGAESLVLALRATTPSGDRSVDPAWWDVRLNALRTMQKLDEFELAALDYCVTYEVSPPAWEFARCHYQPADISADEPQPSPESFATLPMGLHSASAPGLELRGDLLGDATQTLAGLDAMRSGRGAVVVSCSSLIRVDFSAAGGILNWVAVRQSEGNLVQFQDVNRLVAAFFNVIGINEHAKVIPRAM